MTSLYNLTLSSRIGASVLMYIFGARDFFWFGSNKRLILLQELLENYERVQAENLQLREHLRGLAPQGAKIEDKDKVSDARKCNHAIWLFYLVK
jgi:hypothetical protein